MNAGKSKSDDANEKADTESSKGDEAEEASPDEISFGVAKSNIEKIPPHFNMEQAELKYPIRWDNSMNTVLVQELLRFNNLITVIKTSLENFMKAVNGEIVMSADLEQLGSSLFTAKFLRNGILRVIPP